MEMEDKKIDTAAEQALPVQELPADIPAEVRQKLAEDLNEEATEDLKQDMREAEKDGGSFIHLYYFSRGSEEYVGQIRAAC